MRKSRRPGALSPPAQMKCKHTWSCYCEFLKIPDSSVSCFQNANTRSEEETVRAVSFIFWCVWPPISADNVAILKDCLPDQSMDKVFQLRRLHVVQFTVSSLFLWHVQLRLLLNDINKGLADRVHFCIGRLLLVSQQQTPPEWPPGLLCCTLRTPFHCLLQLLELS